MTSLWRKCVASLLSASLIAASFPAVSWATPAPIDPAQAIAFFTQHRVLTGPNDVLKTYLGNERQLTPIGEALYRSLRARYNVGEAVTAMDPSFTRLRSAGPYNDTQRQTVARAFASFQRQFADVVARADDTTIEGSYQWGTLVEAYMTGLSAAEAPAQAPRYAPVALPDGVEYWDSEGLAYRVNRQNVMTYNRQLQQQQRLMNQDRPRQVRFIPETGRYNVEMLEAQYWRLKNQYDDIAKALRIDRLVALAGMLSRQVREERFYLDTDNLERELLEAARGATRVHRGRTWSVLELVDRRLRHRQFYLDGADRAVQRFKTDMDLVAAGETINDAQVASLGLDERNALRWLSLSFLSTQEYAITNQMESLDPASSDSRMLEEALEASPFDARTRLRYAQQGERLRNRLRTLQGLLGGVRQQLIAADYAGSLDLIQAALSSAQREMGEIGTDYALYLDVPSGAFSSASETGQNWRNGQLGQPFAEGWTLGNWGPRAWRALAPTFGFQEHADTYDRVSAQLPQYAAMAEMIARGDMAGARRAAIRMHPNAAARFSEVRLSGGDVRITDAMRIAASLRVNRMDIAAVQTHNKWARTAASFITWTVGIALAAPMVTGVLGGVVRAGEWWTGLVARVATRAHVPWAGTLLNLPIRAITETSRHVSSRLGEGPGGLSPARSQIPAALQRNFVGRYVYSSGVRLVNAGGRQITFTALSGVISGGFTVGQHLFDGSNSQFASWDAALTEGAVGGVVWANDSFHPALGYIGLPSSTFEGIRYGATAAESLAARGLIGNATQVADMAITRGFGRPLFSRVFNLEAFTSGQWAIRAFGAQGLGRYGPSGLQALTRGTGAVLQRASQVSGFTLAMADQVAKYALFSKGVGIAAREISYAQGVGNEDFSGDLLANIGIGPTDGANRDDARLDREGFELERRIKHANHTGHAWEASPIWLLIPTFPAHVAQSGAIHQRAAEGMKQYDAAGLTHRYANAYEGQEMALLQGRPKTPLAQRIFDWSWRTAESSDVWIVTKEARSEGIRKALNQEVGAIEGNLAGVNPYRFYEIMEMRDNSRLRNRLAVNDEVRELARKNLAEALVANPALARRILDARLGTTVEGFGVVRFGVRREIAATLHVADAILGVRVPKDLLGRLGPAHERYVQSDRGPKGPAREAMEALRELGTRAPGMRTLGQHFVDTVATWGRGGGPHAGKPYMELVAAWRSEIGQFVRRGEVTAREANVAVKFLDTLAAIERRFNSFNNAEVVRATSRDVIDAVKAEFGGGTTGAREVIRRMEAAFAEWKPGPGRVAGEPPFLTMVTAMETALREAKGLTATEARVLQQSVSEVKNSPWAVRDKGGNPLPSWKPEQFEALMTTLGTVMMQTPGKNGAVRLFQMLKTGGGKTMVTYEGLLPFAEADAAARKSEVAFLTVQSNLEAQARADYFAYKKMDSRLTFDTYEGLKTKIAEGKTRGRNTLRRYWVLGDEMDGAALQPALTIGEVTGRITRRNSVATRIDEMDLSLITRLENAMAGRANRTLNEARNAVAEARRLDVPNAADIVTAGNRLIRAAEELQSANGPMAVLRARRSLESAAERLKTLTETLPASQAEAGVAMRRSLSEMERVLAEPPPTTARDATLMSDLHSTFRRQRNLLELSGTPEGLQRLMVEARKQRMAGEQRADGLRTTIFEGLTPEAQARVLGREVEVVRTMSPQRRSQMFRENIIELEGLTFASRDYHSPQARQTADAARAEMPIVKMETQMAARFEGVDAGARVLSLSNKLVSLETQLARGERVPNGQTKLQSMQSEISRLEREMPPDRSRGHSEHRDMLRQVHETGRQMGELDAQIASAVREGKPVEALRAQRDALEGQRSGQRARVTEKVSELGSGAADGAFGPGLQRLRIVEGRLTEAKGRAEAARAAGRPDAALESQVARLTRDKAGLERAANIRARELFTEVADDITRIVTEGQPASASEVIKTQLGMGQRGPRNTPGFELVARRMLEQRRKLLDSFAGEESQVYRVYREMKDTMEPIANNQQLLHPDPAVYNKAADRLLRRIEGGNVVANFFPIMQMTYQVFRGRNVTVPVDRVGYSRIYAAKLLRGILMDPIMPPGQRQNLLWTVGPSLFFPKGLFGRSSSWVRSELLKLVQAFHENPAGIRFDGITKRVNVVHNGQWFESMDNESRRFWELHYGADLTLPYTHRSISTIRDLTTDKRANFISFSGTAGSKFRTHLEGQGVPIAGRGSVAPEGVRLDLRASQTEKITAIREAILQSSALSRDHVVIRTYDNMPASIRAEIEAYRRARGHQDKDAVVRITDFTTPETVTWLRQLRGEQESNLVVLSVSDTRVLRVVRNYLIRSGLAKESEIAMVFSDAEFLRLNRPDARVAEQMNLEGLNNGGVRVLILDTRVGGRGLDLNYKGSRDPTVANPFRGYTNYRMLIIDPHEMSAVHLLQAQGRIDVGRVLPGAHREFSLVMDVRQVQSEGVFRQMFNESPFFTEIRKDPAFEAYARQRGVSTVDWALVHDYMITLEARGTAEGRALTQNYRAEVQQYLERRQLDVEQSQLNSSSVSDEAVTSPTRHPGLRRFTPGH